LFADPYLVTAIIAVVGAALVVLVAFAPRRGERNMETQTH
jgi:hypothetical protein